MIAVNDGNPNRRKNLSLLVVKERQWHPTQGLRERNDGGVEMPQGRSGGVAKWRLETTKRKKLIRWVRSWMPAVRGLAPRTLRDRIAVKLQDGLRAQED